jgi:hypothetical protein
MTRGMTVVLSVLLVAAGARLQADGPRTFGEDLAFLQAHCNVVLLQSGDARVAVTPDFQGRVMTSTYGGDAGPSFGWLNYDLIAEGIIPFERRAGRLEAHIHVFGGEDRFWLGPEGGQFALFFKPGDPFEFRHWRTPAELDTEPFELVGADDRSAAFRRDMTLTNASGTRFDLRVDRVIRLIDPADTAELFGIALSPELRWVAYESDNTITNTGEAAWTQETGLLSIWILSMYKPSPATTMVIPYRRGPESELGPKVNDAYFGRIPPEHLRLADGVIYFKGDGTRRGKIGVTAERSRGIAGSFDPGRPSLTLVTYNAQPAPHGFVNSMWEHQAEPFVGDVINAYNDGPPEPGAAPLGPFYELETSSPAAALLPGRTMRHIHRTLHVSGPIDALDRIAREALGVGIEHIANAWDH